MSIAKASFPLVPTEGNFFFSTSKMKFSSARRCCETCSGRVPVTPRHRPGHRPSERAVHPHRPGRVPCSEAERTSHVAQVARCFEVRLRRALPRRPAPPVNRSPRAQPPPRGPRARAHLLALVLRLPAPRARPGLPLLRQPCRRRPVLVALPAAGAAPQQLPG